MRKRVFKKVAVVAITIVACLSTATTAFALYYPKAYYDKISWNYEYSGPYTNSYFCGIRIIKIQNKVYFFALILYN